MDSVRIALEGGCRWIQLRMKGADTDSLLAGAEEASGLCRRYGAIFIVDDHVSLAQLPFVDGVHLGAEDMPVGQAREILGPDKIIGGTANTFDQILNHISGGVDYIGCGPYRMTATKERLSPILGVGGYERIVSLKRAFGTDIPIVGIGGVEAEDIPSLARTGLDGIALSGYVLRAEDPVAQMRRVMDIAGQYWK